MERIIPCMEFIVMEKTLLVEGSIEAKRQKRKYPKAINKITIKLEKKVFCVELNKQYDSITSASKEVHVDASTISKAAKGKLKTAGGYH